MTQIISIRRQDGGLSIMYLDNGEDPAIHVAQWAQSHSQPIGHRVVNPATLPNSRWADAWVDDGTTVTVDIAKAREVKKRELLVTRDKKIKDLTEAVNVADDNGDNQTVAKLKQSRKKLRSADTDLDPILNAANTLADIDNVSLPN